MNPLDRASSLLRAGRHAACRPLLEACLSDASLDEGDRVRAWLLMASVHEYDGELEAALDATDRASALARQRGDRTAEAEMLCQRSSVFAKLGLFRDAADGAMAALGVARAIGDTRIESLALRLMSNESLRCGDEDEARRLLEQSLDCARRAGDDEGEFWALNNLSNVIGIQAARRADADGREAAAPQVAELRDVVDRAMAVARRTGHWLQLAFAVANRADAFIVEGDHAQARALVGEYAGLARMHGSPRLLAYANLDEVRMLRAEGRADAAVALIDDDAHRSLLAGSDDIALATETALYEMHKAAGRFEAALRHHENVSRKTAERLVRQAERQVHLMRARIDLEQARAAAERSRLDAELNAQRARLLEQEHERLVRVAHEDALTGTGNRRAADEALARRLGEPATDGERLCVAMVDIDHFKAINDVHGHAVGDAVLAALGPLMRQGLRSRDQVFRYGGEEFLLILVDASAKTGREVCERLRQSIESHDWSALAPGLKVTASVGLARRGLAEGAAPLVRRADQALYAAKRSGRNRIALA